MSLFICHKEYLERNGVFSTNARQYMFIFCILPELLYQVIQKNELQSNHHIISKDRNLWPIRIVIVIWYDVNMPSEISNICKELGYEVWHRFFPKNMDSTIKWYNNSNLKHLYWIYIRLVYRFIFHEHIPKMIYVSEIITGIVHIILCI